MFIIDDIINAIGAHNAAKAQERQANKALDLQRYMYDTSRGDQMPWLQAGQTTLADLVRQMQAGGFDRQLDPSQIANDPGFQFRMAEGQKALERSAAARGGLNSGGFMKSLSRYSQGVASDEYGRAWERNQADNTNRFNRMATLAGVGQTAAQGLGQLGSNYANSASNLYGAIGNAQAAGAMGVANGIAGGFRSLGGMGLMAMGGGLGGGGAIPSQAGSFMAGRGYIPGGY